MKKTETKKSTPVTLKVADIINAPWNPRTTFDQDLVEEIAADLKAGKGFIQRPSVKKRDDGKYIVIAGNTRMEAARRAKLETVDVELFDVTDVEAMAMTFKENEQRADVHPINQAMLIGEMYKQQGGDVKTICAQQNLKKSSIYDYIKISQRLSPEAVKIAMEHPESFTKQNLMEMTEYTAATQSRVVAGWQESVEEYDEIDKWEPSMWELRRDSRSLDGCKFAGPGSKCASCPKNAANIGALPGFDDVGEGSVARCEDQKCFTETSDAWAASLVAKKFKKFTGEKFELRYSWEFSQYDATAEKQDDEHPCAYYYVDRSVGKVRVLYGPSRKAKLEEEKQRKAEEKAARDAANREIEIIEEIEEAVSKQVLSNPKEGESECQTLTKFCDKLVRYLVSLEFKEIEELELWNDICNHVMNNLFYGYGASAQRKQAMKFAAELSGVTLTEEQKEFLKSASVE